MIPQTPLLYPLTTHPRIRVLHRFYHIHLIQNDEVYAVVVRNKDGSETMWGRTTLDKLEALHTFREVSEHIARERIGGDTNGRQPMGQPRPQAAVDV